MFDLNGDIHPPLLRSGVGQSVWMASWPPMFWEIISTWGRSVQKISFHCPMLQIKCSLWLFSPTLEDEVLQVAPLFVTDHKLGPLLRLEPHALQRVVLDERCAFIVVVHPDQQISKL